MEHAFYEDLIISQWNKENHETNIPARRNRNTVSRHGADKRTGTRAGAIAVLIALLLLLGMSCNGSRGYDRYRYTSSDREGARESYVSTAPLSA